MEKSTSRSCVHEFNLFRRKKEFVISDILCELDKQPIMDHTLFVVMVGHLPCLHPHPGMRVSHISTM